MRSGLNDGVRSVTSAVEVINGQAVKLPVFNGFWLDLDLAVNLGKSQFKDVLVEVQLFKEKPIAYRKYRPNIIFSKKLIH